VRAVATIGAQIVFQRGDGNAVVGVTLAQGGSQLEGRRVGEAVAVPQSRCDIALRYARTAAFALSPIARS
jgi:hypothetical protein